ncbi:Tellurite methyltransferase [hydrothermal vent metagenome]|uniref:Tellurite methyltransferase n=1 Tax=hydrothermal vent metagenome TaxID=652676 RepID=A0A3B0VVA3_9ZZZZ
MIFSQADGILDLRVQNHYQAGHLKNSTSLPWALLPDSLNELPASPATLFLVGDKDEIEAATMLLDAKGYEVNGSLVIDGDEAMQQWAQTLHNQVVTGCDSKRLWSPTPLLVEWVNTLTEQGMDPKALKPRPMALDLGCGGGRDAVFLAQKGWQVMGIDQESRVLKRAKQLATRSKTSVKFKCCDLKQQGCFPEKQFDLVVVVRYLNRALFDQLDQAIAPGGTLVYQTFVTGVEAFGSPKNPNVILEEGELSKVFSSYQIFVDRIDKLKDGRPVSSFIAQKPL